MGYEAKLAILISMVLMGLVSFVGWYYCKEGWISLLYGIGAVLMCVGFLSVLATTLFIFVVASLTSCNEDEDD